jgi:hypothetical protein
VAAPAAQPPPVVAAPTAGPPAAPPPVPSAAPAPPAPAAPRATRPVERTCYECRPGESAIFSEVELAAGASGACPAGLSQQLQGTDVDALGELLAGLPAGCAVLRVDLPRTARYTGFRYEARSATAPSADCFPGRDCPSGGRFAGEPLVRRDAVGTIVFAVYEGPAPAVAGFTVYWSKAR